MDDKKTTPVFSFGSMATQAPSKMTPAATPFSFNTDGLTFGAPTPTLLTERKAEVEFSFADTSKLTGLKQERGVPRTIVQKPQRRMRFVKLSFQLSLLSQRQRI
jgi:hypothetical protein